MKVALIGGTGFVGSYVVDELVASGHEPSLLVRPGSESRVRHPERCRIVKGALGDEDRIREAVEGCDAAAYLVGLLREDPARGITFEEMQRRGAERTIDAAREAGVERFALLSANKVRPDGTRYQVTKWQAEQYLKASGLKPTILRPSAIFGDPRGRMEICTQLRDELIYSPLPAPLFFEGLALGSAGRFEMSPVHVQDVVRVLVRALEEGTAHPDPLVLCGPDAVSWQEMIERIAAAVGRRKLALPAPTLPLRLAAFFLDSKSWFPISRDQLDMLLSGNTGDSTEVFKRFGIEPRRFDLSELSYLAG